MKTFANLIYKKAIDYAEKKQSTNFLAFISFIESFIFPLPTDIFLIPMIIAKRNKYLFLIILTTIFSVLGGMIGYFIGYYFWDILQPYFIKLYPGFEINFENFKEKFLKIGWILVMIGGFTPFPYKIITVSCGILNVNFLLFTLFSAISRFLRFFLVGFIVYKFGEQTKKIVDKYFNIITIIIIILISLYFII